MSLKIILQKNPSDQSSWMVRSPPPAQWTVENGSELKLNGQSIIELPNNIKPPPPKKPCLNDYITGLSEVAADAMCTTITPDSVLNQLQTRIKQQQQNDRFFCDLDLYSNFDNFIDKISTEPFFEN